MADLEAASEPEVTTSERRSLYKSECEAKKGLKSGGGKKVEKRWR